MPSKKNVTFNAKFVCKLWTVKEDRHQKIVEFKYMNQVSFFFTLWGSYKVYKTSPSLWGTSRLKVKFTWNFSHGLNINQKLSGL